MIGQALISISVVGSLWRAMSRITSIETATQPSVGDIVGRAT